MDESYDAEEAARDNARMLADKSMTDEEIGRRRTAQRKKYQADLAAWEARNPDGVERDLFADDADPKPRDPDAPTELGGFHRHPQFADAPYEDLAAF